MKIKNNFTKSYESGFTLLEILLVVAAIAILAGIVIFAINPAKQLGDTRNAERRVDLNTILNAMYQYSIDHHGDFPVTISTSSTEICSSSAGDCGNLVDLYELTSHGKYIISLPVDPSVSSGAGTGYFISADVYNHLTLQAPNVENGVTISITR